MRKLDMRGMKPVSPTQDMVDVKQALKKIERLRAAMLPPPP
jgi:hypothetical protein